MIQRKTIQEIADKIAQRFDPVKVMLFGSYARGDADENSDVDMLVVLDKCPPRGKRSAPILRMIAEDYVLPVDIVVRSKETMDKWQGVSGSFSQTLSHEGITLYERDRN